MNLPTLPTTHLAALFATVLLTACAPEVSIDEDVPPAVLERNDSLPPAVVAEPEPAPESQPAGIETAAAKAKADDDLLAYNADNEITIRGPILGKRYVRLPGEHTGVVVELQPGGDFIDVLMGTTRFNEEQGLNAGIPDRIVVTGSIAVLNGRRTLLARTVEWGDRTFELRDKSGRPLWE